MSKDIVNGSVVYSGLCLELLKAVAATLNFTYTLVEPEDGQWGAQSEGGNWTGLVGMLQTRTADLTVAPLSITNLRSQVMDFADPFFFEKIAILLLLPNENEDKWRVVIEPFRWHVWLLLMLSVVFAALISCLITRIAVGAYPQPVNDVFIKFERSLWYVFGAVLTQG